EPGAGAPPGPHRALPRLRGGTPPHGALRHLRRVPRGPAALGPPRARRAPRLMRATAAVVLLAVVGTMPNAGAGSHPERCALLRVRVERGFLHQMRACLEREARRGVGDAR